MARPQKNTLDYFPMLVTFSQKEGESIRMYYGSQGVDLYIHLLCEIYANGYYLPIDEDYIHVTAYRLHMKENTVRQILNWLVNRNFFSREMYKAKKILTSAEIQQQYQCSMSSVGAKRAVRVEESFWLLEKSETESFIEVYPFDSKTEKNSDKSEKNPCNSEKNPPKEKEKKAKEIKENQTKDESSRKAPAPDCFIAFAGDNAKLLEALREFESFRKKIKAPLTERAKELLVQNLQKLSSNPNEQIEILNQSILSGWKGVFELRSQNRTNQQAHYQPQPPQTVHKVGDFEF